ncbi:hypothetical protein [Bacillus subtilis]|uniref:hypothetical protein n=1 Tax=Bacillus subtilis TaxID=1423 RepID=UPI003F76C6CC
MGVKMSEAYSEKLNRIVSISEVNKKNKEQLLLKCPYDSCRTSITYTEEHTRTYGEKYITIPAYFRLISEDNSPHSTDCIYSTIGELVNIAKNSKGVLESIKDNLFEFRLQVITQPNQGEEYKNSSSTQQLSNQRIQKNNKVKTSGTKSAYLSTIKKILELKSKIEEVNQLQKNVILKNGKNNLNWSNFYFGKHDYYECYSLLENGAEHPICIEGIIKNTNFIRENGFYRVNIELYRFSNREVNKKTLIPSVFINCHGKNLYRKIKEIIKKEAPNKVVVYSDNIHINSNGAYLNINPNVYNDKQIHFWS